MGNKDSNFISSKAFLIGIALLGLIGLAVLLLWRSPCDDIFAQTAPELKVNLKIIENEGAFAVSREKIQELSESAQKVGLHLKTCCYVLEVGSLTAQQFQQCIDKTSDYERQISIVAQQIKETVKVKEKGSADAVQSKIADVNQAIETATGKALTLARFVEEDLTPAVATAVPEEPEKEQTAPESPPKAVGPREEPDRTTAPRWFFVSGPPRGWSLSVAVRKPSHHSPWETTCSRS